MENGDDMKAKNNGLLARSLKTFKRPKPTKASGDLSSPSRFSRAQLLVFVLVFGGVGGYLLFRSFAASPLVAKVEAEQLSLPYNGFIQTDSSASGGKIIALYSNGAATGVVNFPTEVSSFTVMARGDQCSGAPAMTVTVDGHNLINNISVSSTSWSGYSYTMGTNIGPGNHNLSIGFTNDYEYAKVRGHSSKSSSCDRNLYVDVANFYGPEMVSTPPPTVSLSAGPVSVTAGQSATLTWSSTNADSCTASGAWSGAQPTSGSLSTGALNQTSTYALFCSGTGGSANTSTTVTVSTASTTSSGSSIYWGALMDGNNTYDYYYGPTGFWKDAPWGNSGNTWDRFEQNTGKKVSVCHYGQPAPWNQTTFYNSTADICTSRGALVAMDMSTGTVPLKDIAAGKYDSSIATWAKNVKAWGRPFFLRLDTEMNGTWEEYGPGKNGNTPQDFINMWRHFHDVVVAQGATNVTWFWVPNIGVTDSGSVYSLDKFYPGDGYVDWTGLDGYNQDSTYTGFYSLFKPSYDMLLSIAPSKPIGIGETGSHEYGGRKATWITDALTTQLPKNFPQIKMFLWFNWRIYEKGAWQDWPIESSATAQSAFKAGIASSYYAPGSSSITNLQPLTKIQPLP